MYYNYIIIIFFYKLDHTLNAQDENVMYELINLEYS